MTIAADGVMKLIEAVCFAVAYIRADRARGRGDLGEMVFYLFAALIISICWFNE